MSIRYVPHGAADLIASLALYLALCGTALPWFLRRVGPDAVSYISVAMKYRDGHFADAVNGFWSPAFSWLLAPFVRLGPPPEAIARCLQVLIGAGTLTAIWWLCLRLDLPRAVRRFVTLGCVPAVALYALSETSPDLLVAALLTVYIGVVVAEGYPRSTAEAAAAGAIGGLAYLAKAYAFPFFLLHFSVLSCWLLFRSRKESREFRRVWVASVAGLLAFAAIAGPWVAVVSRAYGRFTFGTTGVYQAGLAVGQRNPTRMHVLVPPPNPTAISAWEDPTAHLKSGAAAVAAPARADLGRPAVSAPSQSVPRRSPASDFERLTRRLVHNVWQLLSVLLRLSVLSPLILFGLAALIAAKSGRPLRDRAVVLLGTILIYPSGYLLIFLVPRYLWLLTFLLAASAGLLAMSPWWPTRPLARAWLAAVLLASFAAWPCWVIARLWVNVLEETPAIAARLAADIPPGTRISSDSEWGISNSIAYHLRCRYHGMAPAGMPADEEAGLLAEQQVAVFFAWDDPDRHAVLRTARPLPPLAVASRPLRVFLLGPSSTGGDEPASETKP
jgi:hypothetical protein